MHLSVWRDRSLIDEINDYIKVNMDFTYGAAVVIIVSASSRQFALGIEIYNVSCVIENILIAVSDAGLGNIFLSSGVLLAAANEEISIKLDVPEGYHLISAAPIGYSRS